MYAYLHSQLVPLYKTYNEIIKPLIAEIEVRFERFPSPIYNEIKAYNDHIARCYDNIENNEYINEQIGKAKGHIERIVLDCYKYLNVDLHKRVIKDFDGRIKNIDVTSINNGEFYIEYKKQRQYIVENLKKAKLLEVKPEKEEAISLYEQVHNKYTELELLVTQNDTNICWAKSKFSAKRILKFLGWLMSAIISGFISSNIIPWNELWKWVLSWFT
jgi:SMC interacting uncharacterized protein involved in chromosome segregation